jgi:glutaredoxin
MKIKTLFLPLATTLILFTTTVEAQQTSNHSQISLSASNSNLSNASTKNAIKTTSGKAEIGLAQHLKKIGAKFYGAFWCPHCTRQKELFGSSALKQVKYIECDPKGQNARPNLCRQAGIKAYPTWIIKGKTYTGAHSLQELANISGYKGRRDFKY